ncbi:MAG TPA: polysaccharide biosynthesis tyrosine autokinase [Sphingomicrobium sp.]
MNRDIALRDDRGWQVGPHTGQPAVGGPPAQASAIDFARFLRVLHEWRWLILAATALGLILAVLVTLLTTPLYRARVSLEVNPPRVEIMADQSKDMVSDASPWDFVATQVGLLKSTSVAQRVVEDLNLANNPSFANQDSDPAIRLRQATQKVAKNLTVTPPAEGNLVTFSYVSESPQLAAQIANAYANAFINSALQRRYESSTYARNFLERQIAKTRGDLEKSERQLVAYAQSQGIINTSGVGEGERGADAGSLQGQSLVALNDALAQATARRVAAEGAYRSAAAAGPTSEVTAATQALRQSRAALEAEYQDKRTLMKPDHPEMVSLRSRIEELDRQIARETSNVGGSRINGLQAEYRAALSAERALQARVAGLRGQVLDLRGRSIQYTILQREVDTNRALYDALLQRYKEIGVAGGIGTAPVSIVDRADVPSGPFKPNLLWNLLAGLGIGLAAGIATAFGLEYMNDTIKTRADIRNKLGLACLGAIPKRTRKVPLLEELEDPTSATSEAYSTVSTSLRFSTDNGVPKTLLISSARAGEGKSSTAVSLAHNLARLGKSVLLIDSDLRKPAFRSLSNGTGLTKLLTSDDKVADHVTPTQYDRLCLLACGPIPPNPADLLSSGRLRTIIREAAAQFDVVVVDAPPVIGLADAPLLASVVNDVVLVIESGKTRTTTAQDAMNRLRAAGANIIGATLTKSTEESSAYGYSYKYKYGAIDKDRTEIVMLAHQPGSGSEGGA